MRILITGSNGLLGQHITKQLLAKGVVFLATSQGENRNPDCPVNHYRSVDITSSIEINDVINDFKPTHIIHSAAITNVDLCEDNPELCQKVNVDAVQFLFDLCIDKNIHFQLLSTDFVFDGENGPYSEEDKVNPLSVYARSKVAAESLLINSVYNNWSIVRTIIIYGPGINLSRGNLVGWALEALPKGEPMRLVNDQFRAPTWAGDLAWGCIRICELNIRGVFHLSGPETLAINEIVNRIARYCGYTTDNLIEISSLTLNQSAKRPPRTGFILEKAKNVLNYNPKTIEETLELLRIANESRTNI